MAKEEREFQIELLRVQLREQGLVGGFALVLTISVSILASISATYLGYGLIQGSFFYLYLSAISFGLLFPIIYYLSKHFQSNKIKEMIDRNLDKELCQIYKKYIDNLEEKNTDNNVNKKLKINKPKNTPTKNNNIQERWMKFYDFYTQLHNNQANRAWETIKYNQTLSSALIALTIYSIFYVYTSDFFWRTNLILPEQKMLVKLIILVIPIIILLINVFCHKIFKRQCKRMYELSSIIIKIGAKLGLYVQRTENEYFQKDKWYVPDRWKLTCFSTSKDYVDDCLKQPDRFYSNIVSLFQLFGSIAFLLIILEVILIFIK